MKFAHLADTHLGRQKNQKLRETEKRIFQNMIDEILKNNVDFVLIAGDFFDINLPDMSHKNSLLSNLKKSKTWIYQFM